MSRWMDGHVAALRLDAEDEPRGQLQSSPPWNTQHFLPSATFDTDLFQKEQHN